MVDDAILPRLRPSTPSPSDKPLVVSRQKAAADLGVCLKTIDNMVGRGQLEKVQISDGRVGITWRSLVKRAGVAE